MGVYALWLADAARATGFPVIEVAGWGSRGHGPMRLTEGVNGHHTGTPETIAGDYPSLRVVRDGRVGLPGPLSHLGLGRSGTIYVIAAGLCYHAGASRFGQYVDLNDEFIGIEAEDSGDGKWTDAMLDCYPKLVGSLLRYMSRGVDRYASHRTVAIPAGRKPDPAGISDEWMRERAALFLRGPVAPATGDMHTVIAGETLWSIGRRFGASVQELINWNSLASTTIQPGQVLRVRSAGPPPIPTPPRLPAWSLPRGHYYGHKNGPAQSHGGYHASERPVIKIIQQRLIAKGYVPGVTDWRGAWADGLFEDATVAAVGRFQRREMPRTQFFGQVWSDDYARLAR